MNLTAIKALLDNKQGILSCLNFETLASAVDLEAMTADFDGKVRGDYGMDCWGEPALSIADGIATIKVRGLLVPSLGIDLTSWGITGYDVIEHYLDYANDDKSVNSIVLDIDSGGGYVSGVQQCSEAITNSEKPVTALATGGMYSSAYWLGASADVVQATSYAGVGSIGVYAVHYDYSQELENEGIKPTLFKVGDKKALGHPDFALSDDDKQAMQADINQTADSFFTHVATRRNLTKQAVADMQADCFTAQRAKELGLIDDITSQSTKSLNNQANANGTADNQEGDNPMTEAEMRAKIEAQIRAEVEAEAKAKAERTQAVYALETDDNVKAVLASDDFAQVSLEAMANLINAMPKGFSALMDEDGGAGVEASPTDFADKTNEELEAKAQEEAKAKLAELTNIKAV